GERADRYADPVGRHLTLPIDGAAADRAEMIGDRVIAVAFPAEFRRSAAGLDDGRAFVERGVARNTAGALLTFEAMAHCDNGRFAAAPDEELSAQASRLAFHHVGHLSVSLLSGRHNP